MILDTGSSTLAVDPKVYNGRNDRNLKTTTYGQLVTYGTGGWAGPAWIQALDWEIRRVRSRYRAHRSAITSVQQPGNFEGVTGILGSGIGSEPP